MNDHKTHNLILTFSSVNYPSITGPQTEQKEQTFINNIGNNDKLQLIISSFPIFELVTIDSKHK